MVDMPVKPRRVLLAKPRGYCAGVDRAVQSVEIALERYGAPVYVRKEIVHNKHVVRGLEERGAIFVDEAEEVPEGYWAWLLESADTLRLTDAAGHAAELMETGLYGPHR